MKAAQLVAHRQPLVIGEVEEPKIGGADALVKTEACGMCRSDWHTWNGDWSWVNFAPPLPIIPGHEIGGTVVEVGPDVERIKVGDRVVLPLIEGCFRCETCLAGRSELCENLQAPGFTHNGGYAEYVGVLTADYNCIKLPDSVGMLDAAGLGCRYSAAYNGVVHLGAVRPGEWVTVIGTGGMGLAAVQIATAAGANVVAIDPKEDALALATQQGAVATINPSTVDDVPGAVKEITGGGAHLSIDCHTRHGSILQSLLGLRRAGRHVSAGLTSQEDQGMVALPVDMILALGITFTGTLTTPHVRYPELLNGVARGRLRPAELVTKTIGLDAVNDSINALDRYDTLGMHVITY